MIALLGVFCSVSFGLVGSAAAATTDGVVGDRIWADIDANGVQDVTDIGLAGVTLELLDADNAVVATTVSGPGGRYRFSGLERGRCFRVRPVLPRFYTFSPPDRGVDWLDSDVNPTTGLTQPWACIAYGGREDLVEQTWWDIGLAPTVVGRPIGSRVWVDADADGYQDGNESGVAGVPVSFYDDLGRRLAAGVTGPGGWFGFDNRAPGACYQIQVGDGSANPVPGYRFTTLHALGVRENQQDSDIDPATGRTHDRICTFDGSGIGEEYWAGGIVPVLTTLHVDVAATVFWDRNGNQRRDPDESAVKGAHLAAESINIAGLSTAPAVTDADGRTSLGWDFLGLAAGENCNALRVSLRVAGLFPPDYTGPKVFDAFWEAPPGGGFATATDVVSIVMCVREPLPQWDFILNSDTRFDLTVAWHGAGPAPSG